MKRRFKCSLSNQTETKLKQEYKYKITYPNNQISKYINRLTKGSQRLLKTSELFAGSNISNFFCRAYLPQILMDVTHNNRCPFGLSIHHTLSYLLSLHTHQHK